MMQQKITIPVMDGAFLLAHDSRMLTHGQIKAELLRQIDAKLVKQADVARHLGIPAPRISEIRNGTRRIQQDEMPKLAVFLGLQEPDVKTLPVLDYIKIPNWGRVAQGVWLEQSQSEPDEDYVIFDRIKGDPQATDLFAVTPEGTSMNKRFPEGTRLICRSISHGDGSFTSGSYVIVQRLNHDLREMTCKRVEMDQDGVFWLHSESTDPKFSDPWRIGKPSDLHHDDTEIRAIGKVIRAVLDFE